MTQESTSTIDLNELIDGEYYIGTGAYAVIGRWSKVHGCFFYWWPGSTTTINAQPRIRRLYHPSNHHMHAGHGMLAPRGIVTTPTVEIPLSDDINLFIERADMSAQKGNDAVQGISTHQSDAE